MHLKPNTVARACALAAGVMLLAPACRFVDLDAPLLMGRDRVPALTYRGGWIDPPAPGLWG